MRFGIAKIDFGRLSGSAFMAAAVLMASAPDSRADWTYKTRCYQGGCIETMQGGVPGTSLAAITPVPGPQTDEERDAALARDRKWVEHCKPSLREDRYGMKRYVYQKPGCEFGKSE